MKRHAPATARNTDPIAKVLTAELPQNGRVLEIASGSGEHAVAFARRFPDLVWQPSDPDPDAIASIATWVEDEGITNVEPALMLDAAATWPSTMYDAVFCCNMVHISPWEAAEGLVRNAATVLANGAPLILYGPYIEDDVETAPSNIKFDQWLKAQNPDWGIRNLADLDALAANYGFARARRYAMPANNLMLIYRA